MSLSIWDKFFQLSLERQITLRKREAQRKQLAEKALLITRSFGRETAWRVPKREWHDEGLAIRVVPPGCVGDVFCPYKILDETECVVTIQFHYNRVLEKVLCEYHSYIPGEWENVLEKHYAQALVIDSRRKEVAEKEVQLKEVIAQRVLAERWAL